MYCFFGGDFLLQAPECLAGAFGLVALQDVVKDTNHARPFHTPQHWLMHTGYAEFGALVCSSAGSGNAECAGWSSHVVA